MTYLYVCSFSVPEAPPRNVSGFNLTKHEIYVQWEMVPKPASNGLILGYRVFFTEANVSDAEEFNVTVPFPGRNVTLSPLQPYTFYSIQMLAFTVKGDGPRSRAIEVRTEEEGTYM